MIPLLNIQENVPLAPLCSLELGGYARFFIDAHDESTVIQAVRWAQQKHLAIAILGQGTNLIVADDGFDGVVIKVSTKGRIFYPQEDRVILTASAGEKWDSIVEQAVEDDLAGIECLSGIPGLTGSTVIQNVGAYGQEISHTVTEVRVLDIGSKKTLSIKPEICNFGYRDSIFKQKRDTFIVLSVSLALKLKGEPSLQYPELIRKIGRKRVTPSLSEVRQAVQELRQDKSMLLLPDDENRRSVGSFFINPILSIQKAQRVVKKALDSDIVQSENQIPFFSLSDSHVKLSAGWLIEKSGFTKGWRQGNMGISSRHPLALIHHGGGTTLELINLAKRVQRSVHSKFGIRLTPEPSFLGFKKQPL